MKFGGAAVERFGYIFKQIDDLMHMEHHHLAEINGDMVVSVAEFLDNAGDDDLEMDQNDCLTCKHKKSWKVYLESLTNIVKNWLSLVSFLPDMTLNSSKKYLFKELCEHCEKPNFAVKKAGKYPCIKTEHLKFMDILQFLAPGYNLKSFFKAFGVSEQKGFFSYDYFTSAEQLDETTLPPYDIFYSTIKGCNVLEEEHAAFHKLVDQGKSKQETLQTLRLEAKTLGPKIISGFNSYGLKISGQIC